MAAALQTEVPVDDCPALTKLNKFWWCHDAWIGDPAYSRFVQHLKDFCQGQGYFKDQRNKMHLGWHHATPGCDHWGTLNPKPYIPKFWVEGSRFRRLGVSLTLRYPNSIYLGPKVPISRPPGGDPKSRSLNGGSIKYP